MPELDLGTHRLHYRVDSRDATTPWLVFCNSLGTDLHMWDGQLEPLSRQFRLLRYDQRGHGRSSAPPGPYSLADLGGDVIGLLDALGIERTHFCGLSIGGLTGQWLGVYAPHRLDRLVLCATSPRIGNTEGWQDRTQVVRAAGLASIVETTAERWFTAAFRREHSSAVDVILKTFAATSPEGYCGCCAALAVADLRTEITRITAPVLAVSGAEDPVCPPFELELLARGVQNGRHAVLPGRHIVNADCSEAFNDVVLEFLRGDEPEIASVS